MADDIAARIVLSVEYADAIQKCKEVEVGIEEVTQARQRDIDASQEVKSASAENAKAMEREARAAERVAKATNAKANAQKKATAPERRQTNAEILGMTEAEYEAMAKRNAEISAKARAEQERKFNERIRIEEARAAETPKDIEKRNKATEAIQERSQVLREVKHNTEVLRNLDNKALDEQIAKQKIKNAEIQRELALKKLINAQNERNRAKINLRDPEIQNNPVELQKNQALYDKYTREIEANRDAVFNAERNFRRANKSLDELGKTTSKSTSIFGRAARGIGRSLNSISRIGGKALGMEITTEGLSGPGGQFIAASAAIGGLSLLVRNAMQLYSSERSAEYEVRQRDFRDLERVTNEIKNEADKRQQGINTLQEFTQREKLSNTERLKQLQIIKDLNYALEGMRVEVDATSGRIVNMGAIGWQTQKRDAQREIEQYDRLIRANKREMDVAAGERQAGFWSKTVAAGIMLSTGNFWALDKKSRDAFAQTIKSTWDRTFGEKQAAEVDKREANAYDKQLELVKGQNEARKKINAEAEEKYWKKQNAGLEDRIQAMRETSQALAYSMNVDGNAWKIRLEELKRYSAEELDFLQSETSAENWRQIQAMPRKTIADQKEYNEALSEFNEKMLQRQRIEQKRAEFAQKEREIKRQLDDMREEIRLQKMINNGRGREAQILRLQSEIEKKISREAWSREQAAEWGKLQARQYDRQVRRERRDSTARLLTSESYKYRDTTTAAVFANSLEGLRMQNRMMTNSSPDKALLNVGNKQFSTLKEIKKVLDKINSKNTSTNQTFQTKAV